MFKKLISCLLAVAALLSLAACGEKTEQPATQPTAAPNAEPEEDFTPFYIAKENTANFKKLRDLTTYNEENYVIVEYNGVTYIAKELASGNHKAVYKFNTAFTILDEANKRGSQSFIYFTKNNSDGSIKSLCAFYMLTGVEMEIVKGPCSNFITMDVPQNYELYPYGFIVNASTINVVDLKSGALSSYTKTIKDVNSFFETPQYFFSSTTSTKIAAFDRTRISVEITETGEETTKTSFAFYPLLGVCSKTKK